MRKLSSYEKRIHSFPFQPHFMAFLNKHFTLKFGLIEVLLLTDKYPAKGQQPAPISNLGSAILVHILCISFVLFKEMIVITDSPKLIILHKQIP